MKTSTKINLFHWINPHYLQDKTLTQQFLSNTPFPHIVLPLFFLDKKIQPVAAALLRQEWQEKESDLFQKIDTPEILTVKMICELFPEMNYLSEKLINHHRPSIYTNPYQLLLQSDPDYRTVLAGVMMQAESENLFKIVSNQKGDHTLLMTARGILTSERIIQYAEKIGEKNVIPYLRGVTKVGMLNKK